MRLVLRPARRRARLCLPGSRGTGRRTRARDRRGDRRRRAARPGAGGVRRGGRGAVRLLHAGLIVATVDLLDRSPPRATTRSARRSRGTSAGARDTGGSSMPCAGRQRREHGRAAARARGSQDPPPGRCPQGDRRLRVLERPQSTRDALGKDAAEPPRARAHRVNRSRPGAPAPRGARCPDPCRRARREDVRPGVPRPAGARDRSSALSR